MGTDHDAGRVLVAGGSIHAGHLQRELLGWLRARGASLDPATLALFCVSLSAVDDSDEGRTTTAGYLHELTDAAGCEPAAAVTFAGALQYREYNPAVRLMLKLIAHSKGLPTDTSTDVDFTDWDAVDTFADGVAERLAAVTA